MKLIYLSVPEQDEERVLSAGAWYSSENGMYAITKYQNPDDFAGMENGLQGEWNDLSLTMACRFMGLDRKAAQEYLIREGYLSREKWPTKKGENAGIRLRTRVYNGKESSYVVYPDEFLDQVLWPQKDLLQAASAKTPSGHRRRLLHPYFYTCASPAACSRYKKLRLPDSVLFPGVISTGKTAQDEVSAIAVASSGEEGSHQILLEQSFSDAASFVSCWRQLCSLLAGHTPVGYNLPLIRRLLLQTAKKYSIDPAPLLSCFSPGVDVIDIARTFLPAESFRQEDLARMPGLAFPAQLSAKNSCLLNASVVDALEDRPFIPLAQAIVPSAPSLESARGGNILHTLAGGSGIDGAVEETGVPEDLIKKTFLSALSARKTDPQWVMTLEREQELFTYNPDGSLASCHDYDTESDYGEIMYVDAYCTYSY